MGKKPIQHGNTLEGWANVIMKERTTTTMGRKPKANLAEPAQTERTAEIIESASLTSTKKPAQTMLDRARKSVGKLKARADSIARKIEPLTKRIERMREVFGKLAVELQKSKAFVTFLESQEQPDLFVAEAAAGEGAEDTTTTST